MVKALYDYDAGAPGELSVKEDEELLVFDKDEDWLLVKTQTGGHVGYVPGNYVEEVYSRLISYFINSECLIDRLQRSKVQRLNPNRHLHQLSLGSLFLHLSVSLVQHAPCADILPAQTRTPTRIR